ncbi:hypothetical protein P3386_24210, partial [Vibrio parahaemolyticus]|nr:hypothetical protein [Vibrio parahaemolyticus]
PAFFYFFQPITIVLGGATATVCSQKYCQGETGFGVTRPQKYHLQDANHGRKMATSPQDQTPQKLVKDVLKTVENCYTGGGRAGLQRVARSAQ